MDLGEWVKAERGKRGWTQERLAELSELRRTEINAIEAGTNKGSSARVRAGLRRAFGVALPGDNPEAVVPRPVFRDRPEWSTVAAEVLRRYRVLRDRPQAVEASGETSSLLISGPLTVDMVREQAMFWLTHGDPDALEKIETALVDAELEAARAAEAAGAKR